MKNLLPSEHIFMSLLKLLIWEQCVDVQVVGFAAVGHNL